MCSTKLGKFADFVTHSLHYLSSNVPEVADRNNSKLSVFNDFIKAVSKEEEFNEFKTQWKKKDTAIDFPVTNEKPLVLGTAYFHGSEAYVSDTVKFTIQINCLFPNEVHFEALQVMFNSSEYDMKLYHNSVSDFI